MQIQNWLFVDVMHISIAPFFALFVGPAPNGANRIVGITVSIITSNDSFLRVNHVNSVFFNNEKNNIRTTKSLR